MQAIGAQSLEHVDHVLHPGRQRSTRSFRDKPVALRTLLNQSDRALILERLRQLTPEARATWGTLGATVLSCDRIRFSWAATDPAFGSGSRELVRVLPRAEGVVCP